MKIIDVLKNERPVFVIDDIEDKKTKNLIMQINKQMASILGNLEKVEQFCASQLNGEYADKIVMAKSLQKKYSNWLTIKNACQALKNEENKIIDEYYSFKKQLIANLKVLLFVVKKFPVVSAYDVFNSDFALARKGHNIVILGNNNTGVIESIILEIESGFNVSGNYDSVEGKELTANYSSVDKNVSECKRGLDSIGAIKSSKEEKILFSIEQMENSAKELVFFATYKEDLKNVGCNVKEIELYEKELLKKYVPVKKQLSKILKVDFIDVCNIIHNEDEFPTQEFKAINDFFEE